MIDLARRDRAGPEICAEGPHRREREASDLMAMPFFPSAATPPPRAFTPNGANTAGTLMVACTGCGELQRNLPLECLTASRLHDHSHKLDLTPFAGFAPHVYYTAGSLSLSTAIGDLNGRPTGLVPRPTPGWCHFLGNGDGTFAPKTDFTRVLAHPSSWGIECRRQNGSRVSNGMSHVSVCGDGMDVCRKTDYGRWRTH